MSFIHDAGPEAPQRSDPTQGDGDSAGTNSDHDSRHEAPQRSDPTQGDGESAGSAPPTSYSPTNTGQCVDVTNENTETLEEREVIPADVQHISQESSSETLEEREVIPADVQHISQESSSETLEEREVIPADVQHISQESSSETLEEREVIPADVQHISQESSSEITAANGSEGNGSTLTPTAQGCGVDSNSLSGITHTHHAENNNMVHDPAYSSGWIQETDTSSNTLTNDHISDLTTGPDCHSETPSTVTDPVEASKAEAEVRHSLSTSNTALCPFSEQPLQHHDNSPREIDGESANNQNLDSELHAETTSISQEHPHQAALDAEQAGSGSSAAEDRPLLSPGAQGPSQVTGSGIRNLFPQVSVDSASAGRDRSSSEMDARDVGSTKDNAAMGEDIEGDVVLVTGGCGFLGQHIVKMLNLRAPHVGEIRVLDLVYFEKKLDYPTTKRVKSLVGDVANAEFVRRAFKGVNSVIHVAAVVSWGTFPDYSGMERVNVQGTLNVLNSCLENKVQRLIYCSTVDVAVGSKPIRGGTEEDTPIPDKFLFPGYPETKFHGERIILGSADLKRRDGEHLQTVILRPNVLYGELDKYYITNALRMAKKSMGVLYQIGNGKALFQQAYVGNAAWAFVCADAAMKAHPGLTREVFYVPDNTPVQNSFAFMMPFLQAHGLKLSSGYLSYALSHSAVAAAELLAKALSPVMKLNLPVQSCTIAYINTDLYFRGEKAERMLNYYPVYTPSEASEMSMKFYDNLDLEEKWRRGSNPEHR